ncbi:hypothetical protein ES288_D02G117700v1 [Gossypium darwinii]|uniref:Secretory carrier-associated membrane protein n=1 Tax=Gossypium darwinii TaxID=34276 RepID=A0A5D2DFD1_GOSDA|nr:hypothetical protein ES288_D02G117700v1 [Gossypium darwinii]
MALTKNHCNKSLYSGASGNSAANSTYLAVFYATRRKGTPNGSSVSGIFPINAAKSIVIDITSYIDKNPFDEEEEEVSPFADTTSRGKAPGHTTSIPPASNSRLSPLPPKPTGFSYEREATINIPLDIASRGSRNQDLKKKEKELQSKEADLRRREQEVRRKEEAVARAGVVLEEKNWPPFFLSFIMILLMKF